MLRWLIFWNFFLVYVRASLRQERTLETRLGEGRIRAREGKGTPATTLLFTPNCPLFPWPGCIAGVFLFCFVFLLWLVSRRYSRAKAGTRCNQKTVGEGSRGEVSRLLAPSPIVFSLDLARPCKYEPEMQIAPKNPPATFSSFTRGRILPSLSSFNPFHAG